MKKTYLRRVKFPSPFFKKDVTLIEVIPEEYANPRTDYVVYE